MNPHDPGEDPAPTSLSELWVNYLTLARRALRYWPRGLALLLLVMASGLTWTARRPRVYTSLATFEVGVPDGSELSSEERDRQLEQRAAQAYESSGAALGAIEALNLYPELRRKVSRERQAMVFRSNFRWRVEGGALHLGFTHGNPRVAQRVVDHMILRFTQDRRSAAVDGARRASSTVEAQLEQSGRVVASHQEELEVFENTNHEAIARVRARQGIAPVEAVVHPAMSPRTRELRARISSLEAQRDSLRATGRQDPPSSDGLRALELRASALRLRVSGLRSRQTERHPELITAERELREAEASGEAERARLRENTRPSLTENERTERIRALERDLSERRAELSRSEVEERSEDAGVQAQRHALRLSLPEVETQWARLRANLATAEAQDRSLLQEKYRCEAELARIGVVGAELVRVLDAPSRPVDPDPPGRAKLSLIVVLLALVLGAGCSFLSGILDPRIYDESDLARWGELALLSAIPDTHTT